MIMDQEYRPGGRGGRKDSEPVASPVRTLDRKVDYTEPIERKRDELARELEERAVMKSGILTAYFVRRDEARKALRELGKRGFRRAALIHKTADGHVHTLDPFVWRRAATVALSAALLGALAGGALLYFSSGWPFPDLSASLALWIVLGALLGAVLGWVGMRRSRHGVERRLMRDHSRWLATEETVIILQAPIDLMRFPVAVLRESGEIPPVVSFLNPKRESLIEDMGSLGVPLSPAQMQEHAVRLAAESTIDPDPRRDTVLLRQLRQARQWIHVVCKDLSEEALLEQRTTPIAEWILDNEYIIEGNVRDVQQNLSRRFYEALPVLDNKPYRGLPRIYGLARELVSHAGLRLDRENIIAFVEAYQSVRALSIAELWAIPQMLRITLIEGIQDLAARGLTELRDREIADFWANRLITANRRDPNHLFAIMAELTESQPVPSRYFAFHLIDHLYDEEAALAPVQSWLERVYRAPLSELSSREQNRQTKDQISIGNAFTSLRQLALLDWRQIFEHVSKVERSLRLDPSGIYARMDFATRDRYRRVVEAVARRSGTAEEKVAQSAVELAARAAGKALDDKRWSHVGAWLTGEGRRELARLVQCREAPLYRVMEWAYRHHSAVYFLGLSLVSLFFVSLIALLGLRGQTLEMRILVTLLSLFPVSQLALEVVNYVVMRVFPPRTLAKMDFELSGIPDAFRTLVVVPMLLVDRQTVDAEADRLEIRYLANREDNLLFSLFTDYTDSEEAHHEQDEPLLQSAISRLTALNERYGSERFFLFHRERTWSESEQRYIGWERKRGKLEELNRLIDGTRPQNAGRLVYVGHSERLADVRFVITLDSDTQLPSGTARRMIETLAHPLNQPRFDEEGRILPGSYTIIQPRVSPSLPSTSASPFSRLFSYVVGIDPYTRAVSDVNQDLAGEGSYHGKGIYDVHAFSRALSGRFPEEWLLSHDLIEGAHVRVGLASDIELLDEFPRDYLTYARRQHRWIRGDWQIADWTLPHVPLPGGRRGKNTLSWFNRWKILDNLRRSLIPTASLALLAAAWLTSSRLEWICTLVVVAQLFFQTLAQPLTSATTRQGLKRFSLSKLAHDVLRTVVEASLIPHQTWLALNAILRVWYRRLFSHRHLLEWTPSGGRRANSLTHLPVFLLSMCLISLLSAVAAWALFRAAPESFVQSGPWLGLWFLSPLIGWLLNLRPRTRSLGSGLPARDMLFLGKVARKTWRFFSDFVSEETSWLPPDNYQVFHQDQLAMRTSPTNIGLWMLSALAARGFGYRTGDQTVQALRRSMETIVKLERYEGHLLNWYDVQSLKPLEPRYVSTVDSGNLLGALISLEHGLEEMIRTPVLDARAFGGLRDTGEVFKEAAAREGIPHPNAGAIGELTRISRSPTSGVVDQLRLLRRLEGVARAAFEGASRAAEDEPGSAYWAVQIRDQVSAWRDIRDRYLTWIEIIAEKTEEQLAGLGAEALQAIHGVLEHAPSLYDLATGNVGCMPILRSIRGQLPSSALLHLEWLDRVLQAFDTSKWLAGEMLEAAHTLIQGVHDFSGSISMRFLYDVKRKLFAIGFNVSDRRLDSAFYDLLASESRIGSFIAIARGEVPLEHWFSMSRPYNAIGRRRVLLSWTGTMFEYLMPLLFQRSYEGSLLDRAAREAVAVHIEHGRTLGVPWGVSESAYTDLDVNKTYQYKAFGVPELGLKRGAEEELVVAPYASLLAVAIAPRRTVANLRRLASLGLLNEYGYYEAIDFSRQPSREGGRGVIVRAYMAHHHGMGFLSLNNFLHGNPTQRHFHADARVRAVEPLLHESVPVLPSLYHISTRQRVPSVDGFGEIAPSVSRFDSPHTGTPKTQLLGNGRYSLMVTNSGGGYSQWGDFEITRWRSDLTRDSWGQCCYVHEADSDRLWSTTYHPADGKVESYIASFALDRAVFGRVDNGIETETEVVVSSEDDVEIRRITLINRSVRTRHLDLTSYIELSLAPHRADLPHPAFNKLFIQTEAIPEHHALLASRRPRGEGEPAVFVAHRMTLDPPEEQALRFETDRRSFIGRGRTRESPAGAFHEPDGSQGFVLDPIFSLRRSLALGPGERMQVSLVIAAGPSRLGVLGLMDKYGDPHAIDRAMDFAWASAQLELRLLRIQPDEARRFQEIASHLLFPNLLLRPPAERIEENRKGQAGLWRYGISGDAPIALVSIGEARDIGLVRQMLQAHSYWRMRGLKADLVILDEEASGYERPLHDQLEALVRATSTTGTAEQTGKVHLWSTDQLPKEDLALFMAAARVVLVAARGTLPQQIGVAAEVPEALEFLARKRAPRDPSAPLPFMELPYFNSVGGFTPDGREYAIYLGPGTSTPAPWVNVIANPTFGTLVSETGAGFTWFGNSQRNRLTDWSNDPVTDPPSEALYIRDEETGVYWTPTRSPVCEESAYRARHGAGYTVFEHNSRGIEQELTVFVPVDESGGQPIKLQRLRLRNDTSRVRTLSLTYYVEWTLGENRESSQMHVATSWDDESQAVLARNHFHPEYGSRVGFAAISPAPQSYGGDRTSFIGRNRGLAYPAAMERTGLSMRTGAGMDPCAALQTTLEMAPGEKVELTCMLGQAESVEEVRGLVLPYRSAGAVEAALESTKAWWDDRLGTVEVHTPELAADFLINRWLLYQSMSCRIWGRSASYQSGGAFGFRDQLQDVMALLYARPEMARQHILRAASRQFKEGDVQHWWHPPSGAGIRSRISDDLLWLPHVVAQYVRVTGDKGILDAVVPFLSAAPLESEQREVFSTPEVSAEGATLFDHCRRAVSRGLTVGPHGLPLMGTGDWNDGMNLVGAGGKGESVWLGWFLVDVLHGMTEMSVALGRVELARGFEQERQALVARIEAAGWDGEWYLRAFFDDGTPLGSSSSTEARIDSIPQSWASLSGVADPDRAKKAMDSAWRLLVREEEGLVLLFDPPFDKTDPSPGYIKGYPPGVRENGGQYTHAALWFAMALARQGDGERAVRLLRLLNPIEHTGSPDAAWRYGVEPYVIAADVYRLPGRIGQGGWSWYTGSAAWMYRAWVEEVIGMKIRGETLRMEPVIPGWWHDFSLRYRHGEAIYEIQVENPEGREHGVAWVEMDGRRLAGGCIPLERGLVKHRILVRMGDSSRP
jgi:cyclic beta-1,2-glucan synthetase